MNTFRGLGVLHSCRGPPRSQRHDATTVETWLFLLLSSRCFSKRMPQRRGSWLPLLKINSFKFLCSRTRKRCKFENAKTQEKLSLLSRYYRLALLNQNSISDFCLTGVPPQMTFANYKSTLSKPQCTRTNYESDPNYEQKCSDYDWRSSTWNFQTTNGPKSIYETKIRVTTTILRILRADSMLRFS